LALPLLAPASSGSGNTYWSTSSPKGRRTAYVRDFYTTGEHPQWRNMATSQNPNTSRRRTSVGDGSGTGAATPPGTGPTPDRITEHHTGHRHARGTLSMAPHPCRQPAGARRAPTRPNRPDRRRHLGGGVGGGPRDHARPTRRDSRAPRQRQPTTGQTARGAARPSVDGARDRQRRAMASAVGGATRDLRRVAGPHGQRPARRRAA